MTFPKLSTVFSYLSGVATLVVAAQAKVTDLPFSLPPWALTALASAGIIARVVLHFTKSPTTLQPTPNLTVDDTGPALGKASGEAGAAAGKGPFVR